jgi:hypothetical protein
MPDKSTDSNTDNGNSSGFNDREPQKEDDTLLPKPQIEIIVDGNGIYKPGMKTFFIEAGEVDEDGEAVISSQSTEVISGEFCTCDVVYTTVPSSSTECTCDPFCTCENNCSCVSYTAPSSNSSSSCSCQSVSCGSPCACVPVH